MSDGKTFVASATLAAVTAPYGRVRPHGVVDVLEPVDLGVLEDPHAQREAGALETPDQARGVDERRAVDVEERAHVGGGVDARLHLLLIEDFDVVAHLVAQARLLDAFPANCQGATATRSSPVRSQSHSMP